MGIEPTTSRFYSHTYASYTVYAPAPRLEQLYFINLFYALVKQITLSVSVTQYTICGRSVKQNYHFQYH